MDASLHGAILEIPPLKVRCSHPGALPASGTVSGG